MRRCVYVPLQRLKDFMASKTVVGEKIGMTQIWVDNDRVVPVTVIRVLPARVLRRKTIERDGYEALQVAVGVVQPSRLTKPVLGQFTSRGVEPGRKIMEFRLEGSQELGVGSQIDASAISSGDRVDVIGTSRGHGFSGGMKRHNFKGQGGSHGNHKKHRAPGSIGACATPARVFKGTRMAGQYGSERTTIMNLEVVRSEPDRQLLLIKGAVPGPRGAMVVIRDTVKGGKRI
jgi:large subunit ribosomal protein L3